jgi:hypothetical protein
VRRGAAAARRRCVDGGTPDPTGDSDLARELSDDVLELPGADHTVGVAGDPRVVLANLEIVVDCVDSFAASPG